ncbi:MAG: hemolysin family protein [Acholeplasmataceae bacterium]
MILSSILVVLFTFFIAILSAAQVAVVAVSNLQVEDDVDLNKRQARKVLKIIDEPGNYLVTIQTHISLLTITSSALVFTYIFQGILSNFTNQALYIKIVSILVLGFILLLLQVVFGRMIPKRLANKHPKKLAYNTAGFVLFLSYLTKPLDYLFTKISIIFGHLFGLQAVDGERLMTEEEIRNIVEESSKSGKIEASESEMIQNIFDFSDTLVEEIMTHRTEIAALNIKSTKKQVMTYVQAEHFTRYPVFEKDLDHIVGTVHVKDLLRYVDNEDKFVLKDILREPILIPDSKKTSELFTEMQKEKNHIAIVLDEYGGTAGLVTIEDLIEEIVGNIFDEYDEVEEDIHQLDANTYIVNGLTSINDIEDDLDIDLPVDDYDTLSGFILGQLGRLPNENEKIDFNYEGHEFSVLEIEQNVIKKVKIVKHDDKGENED